MLFEPLTINNVVFANRALRSSLGGRTAYYDGTVSPAWVHFEKRFARGGVGGIISPTISVNEFRQSPLEYPSLHDDRFVGPLREALRDIKAGGRDGPDSCRYIIQLGDTGGHTHFSMGRQDADRVSSSAFFDFLFGYQTTARAMTVAEIERTIDDFRQAARRARQAGCDGIEVTASKGYLIHQFLNPAVNRRTDLYGGSIERRFRLLREIVEAIRDEIGRDFLFGVRLSASDYHRRPVNIRFPLARPLPTWREFRRGSELPETTYFARRLQQLGIDYLHIDSGYAFRIPRAARAATRIKVSTASSMRRGF